MPKKTSKRRKKMKGIGEPIQFKAPQFDEEVSTLELADDLINICQTRNIFSIYGSGLTVAVLDSGLRTSHVDFEGRIVDRFNFTNDNNGDEKNVFDGYGHGTHISGIICANKEHIGVAPRVNIIPLKILNNNGKMESWKDAINALEWVIQNKEKWKISVVCMALSNEENYQRDDKFKNDRLRKKIRALRKLNIPTVVPSGNHFFNHYSLQGMSYPAILRETISVGAVYNADIGGFYYEDLGAEAYSTGPDRITPFSQRLHQKINPDSYTNIFAPGDPITSSGIDNDHGETVERGTSQAAPVVAGALLLMQEYYLGLTRELPSVTQLGNWLEWGSVKIHDGDDESDNVIHTNLYYKRIDALDSIRAIRQYLRKSMVINKKSIKKEEYVRVL